MSRNAVEATLDQLRNAESTMGRMLNVLEGMQQERQAATQLSASIGVMSRLMEELLAERERLIDEVVTSREAIRQRDDLVARERVLLDQLAESREANRELSDRLRDTIHRLDATEERCRREETRLQDGHNHPLGASVSRDLPLVNLPPGGTTLNEIEFEAVVQALTRSRMVAGRAAAMLGMSERALTFGCAHIYRDRLKQRGIIWEADPCQSGDAAKAG